MERTVKIKTFVSNEHDDLHCLQACVRMIIDTAENKMLSVREVEEFTGFVSGLQTWPYQTMLSFADRGYYIENIEAMDHREFANDPRSCVIKEYGEEMWEHFLNVSDVEKAQNDAKRCVSHERIKLINRIPDLELIKKYTGNSFQIINLNAKRLRNIEGYNGHFILLESIIDNKVYIQNPGLPPVKNQEVDINDFIGAWHCPNARAANVMVVKYG